MGAVARQGNNEKTNIKELNFDELCIHNHLHGSVDLLVLKSGYSQRMTLLI